MKKLSVIVPCFNEEESIPYFYEEIKKLVLEEVGKRINEWSISSK